MSQTFDDFRSALTAHADRVQRIRDHVKNEEATKVSLILPFLGVLGYDDRDPTEVAPEHPADFSDKYKNRVDYAVMRDGQPIIAVECKSVGNGKKDDRGQLRAYFNAARTVKLGVLSDGIRFEFFVDSQEPNMMDEDPYMEVDIEKIAKGQFSETLLESLFALSKDKFDPDSVSDNARRSITHRSFFDYLAAQFLEPSAEFTRFLLKENDIKHIRGNAIDVFRLVAKAAFQDVFNAHVLKRLDITGDVPKAIAPKTEPSDLPPGGTDLLPAKGIVTTDAEIKAFEALRRRLAFLAGGRGDLFDAISKVQYRDYIGKMVVFYNQERKGRLLDILETKGGIRYQLADALDPNPVSDLSTVDARLREIFERRVTEASTRVTDVLGDSRKTAP